MIKYWVVGTSSKKYIDEFMNLLKEGLMIGDEFVFNREDKKFPHFTFRDEIIQKSSSYIVMRQRINVWEAMGLIRKTLLGYKVLFDSFDKDKIIEFSKIFIFDYSEDKKVTEFRNSTLINVLAYVGLLSISDINYLGIKQTRGKITMEKIMKSISLYERDLSKDKEFTFKALKVVKNEK